MTKKLKNIWLIPALAMAITSCSQDDDKYIGGSVMGGQTALASLYPVPPAQWAGGESPYYSAGYVGDIMPYFDNGKFHIFFLHEAQNNPAGIGFHGIHEFETTDMASFSYQGEVLHYGGTNDADFAIGTGSVAKAGSTYYFYYSGHNENAAFLQDNPRQSVLCATSTNLKNWTKLPSFKITAPAGYSTFDFRDPQVFYNDEENKYWMLVSARTQPANTAVILKFTTNDPATGNWQAEGPLYTATAQENYLMMECPDLFKIGSYWYLVFSEDWSGTKGTHYRMATTSNGPWTTPEHDMLDGEYFYAAKTASDGNNRYLFGWTARKAPENDTGGKTWAGNMVTHELTQNADGTLAVKAPQAIAVRFSQSTQVAMESSAGSVSVTGNTYALNAGQETAIATFANTGKKFRLNAKVTLGSNSGWAGFVFHTDADGHYYKIVFEPAQGRIAAYNSTGQEVTRVPFNLEAGTAYNVELITEGSICVLYVNGKVALSNRIYGRDNQKWGLIASGTGATITGLEVNKPQ